jgi:hypothetical protein
VGGVCGESERESGEENDDVGEHARERLMYAAEIGR